jgi:hypothetical protein
MTRAAHTPTAHEMVIVPVLRQYASSACYSLTLFGGIFLVHFPVLANKIIRTLNLHFKFEVTIGIHIEEKKIRLI